MIKRAILFTVSFLLVFSCANVKQIDRGKLSSRIMQLNPTPEASVFINEVDSFREGSAGGSAAVGGGCGCN